jgi:protein involved in polysaccharide export with SLBB domain
VVKRLLSFLLLWLIPAIAGAQVTPSNGNGQGTTPTQSVTGFESPWTMPRTSTTGTTPPATGSEVPWQVAPPAASAVEGRVVQPQEIRLPPVVHDLTKIDLQGQAGDAMVQLTWRQVDGGTPVVIQGFLLLYGPQPGDWDHRLDLQQRSGQTVTGLRNGTDYRFQIVAYDDTGQAIGRSDELVLQPNVPDQTYSTVERLFGAEEVDQAVSRDLRQFGYDLFAHTGGAFNAALEAPPGPDYPVGPGDVLEIFLWGQVDDQYTLTIDADGSVRIPNVGAVPLGGLTLKQATDKIHGAVARQFSGFHLSVSLKELRTIQVYVVGEVGIPGNYSLGALATVFNGLFAAAGPTKQGSLRAIRLRHADGSGTGIDLYDFLMHGDRSADLRLSQGDTLFVPLIGETVGVSGQVKRPAIYELKPDEGLNDALEFAGGVTAYADPRVVQVERVEGQLRRVVAEFPWAEAMSGGVPLQSGDLVSVRAIYPQVEGRVTVTGAVKQPGSRPWQPGLRLSTIFQDRSQFLPGAFLDYAELKRTDPTTLRVSIVSFSPAGLLAGRESDNLVLADQDTIQVFSEEELARREYVQVSGEVATPGQYQFFPGMRVRDLVYRAGNLTSSAYLEEGEITRLRVEGQQTTTERIYFNVADALADRGEHNQPLLPNDQLFIRAVPDWSEDRVVVINGEVQFPGTYTFRRGERISEVLERAGGFAPNAFPRGAVFTRESVRVIQQERLRSLIQEEEEALLRESTEAVQSAFDADTIAALNNARAQRARLLETLRDTEIIGRMVVRILPLEQLRGSPFDLELEEGDTITIPPIPSSVNVLGRVYNPTSLIYEEQHPVTYYLAQTGGLREEADDDHIYLVRTDGTVISRAQERRWTWWWNRGERRWLSGSFDDMVVERGDTILVPEKVAKVAVLRGIKDISEILANIFVSAGNLKFLFQ